jgi:hypothetical protein
MGSWTGWDRPGPPRCASTSTSPTLSAMFASRQIGAFTPRRRRARAGPGLGRGRPARFILGLGPRQSYDLTPSKRTRQPMSKIDSHSDLMPSRKEQRILMRALGCGVEELVARLGAENAIKRVETELRRARQRPLTRAPRVLERHSRQDRDEDRRAAEHEARTKRAAHGHAG